MSLTTLLIQDIINAPTKAESILETLTTEQIGMIENTINRVKRRKLDKAQQNTNTTEIANALAAAMVSAALQVPASNPSVSDKIKSNNNNKSSATCNEPVAEVKDGIEWVSFVYSHNRTLKRYSIRTDIQNVMMDAVEDKFKAENCVYPRANLPKESYKGNRWAYETECNDLGWKLAWLNKEEIAGKRGLIQRAVDSYRNRYPSMRSRRVARQEKLLNGTLRKRKNKEDEDEQRTTTTIAAATLNSTNQQPLTSLEAATIKPTHQPKTIAVDDFLNNTRYRIKINVESISLDEISIEFRNQNSVFPRAVNADPEQYIDGRQRWTEDMICNELGWKLAYLNPRVLAGKKNLLQRALDVYRNKFMPLMKPRHRSRRSPPVMSEKKVVEEETKKETMTLDFNDCFSLDDEALPLTRQDPMISPSYDSFSPFDDNNTSSSSSVACTPSPPVSADLFGFADTDLYDSFMLPPVNDSFMLLENNSDMKYALMSPSTTDLVKLEQDFQDNYSSAAHLLDPLF